MSSLTEKAGIPNIHFIIPQRFTSEEQCSECMRQAFQTCVDHMLKPKWIEEKLYDDIKPTKKDVFVFEKFKGVAFNYFQKFKCVVLGPRCVLACLSSGQPIPRGANTIFSVAMDGLIVTLTGFNESDKVLLSQKIQYMGGTYIPKLLKSVTHVVVNSVRSKKYERAMELGLTCVTVDWVQAVWEATQTRDVHGSDEDFLTYKCKALHNLQICITNFRGSEKDKLKRAIEEHGGIFCGNFVPDSTELLIVANTGGEKYKAAQDSGVPCLSSSWVFESIKQGRALELSEFEFNKRGCSTPNSDTRYLPDISTVSAIHSAEQYRKSQVNETVLNDTLASVASNRTVAITKGRSEYLEAIEKLELKDAQKAGPFLDGCNIYLSGFSAALSDKLRRLLKFGQATKYNEISDSVSHVVVGNVVLSDMQAVKSCVTRPHVVSAQWLLESLKRCSPAPEEPFLCFDSFPAAPEPPSPSLKKGLEMLQSRPDRTVPCMKLSETNQASQKEEAKQPHDNLIPQYLNKDETFKDLGGGNLFRNTENLRTDNTDAPSQALSTLASQSDTTVPVFFEDLTFMIVGLDDELREDIQGLISMFGGTIVGNKFLGVPDYAVVPFTGAVLHHTTNEVVSHLWVEDCYDNGGIVPFQYYHYPVTVQENVRPLAGCVIGITSYIGRERDFIIRLSELLGAIAQEVLSRKNSVEKNAKASTHLICREPGSQKYNAAIKWKLPAVTHEWLLACLGERRRVELKPYLVGASTAPDEELRGGPNASEHGSLSSDASGTNKEAVAGPRSETPLVREASESGALPSTSRETVNPVPTRSLSDKSSLETLPKNVYEDTTKILESRNTTPATSVTRCVSERLFTPPVSEIKPIATKRASVDTPTNISVHYGFSQETPLNISRIRSKTSSTPSLRRTALTPKTDQHHAPNVEQSTPQTPKPPGYIETPETPYGLGPNPSPETRKNWKRWINAFPDLKQDDPVPEQKRRNSTPLSELYRRCWAKFGAKHAEYDAENSPTAVPEVPNTEAATEANLPETPKISARKRLTIHDSPEFTQPLPVNSQVSATTGINTQLANLNELLASPRVQQPASIKRTSSALENEDCARTEDSREKQAKISRDSSVKEVAWTYDATQSETTTTYKFMFSTMEEEERMKYTAVVTRLGGSVVTGPNFDPTATHLISTKLSRSEKLLTSIASGKWVLHKEFLDISSQHGCFSEEEHFEWGNPATLHPCPQKSLDTDLAKACHYWRKKLSESGRGGAFKGFRAIMATDASKAGPLSRLILAGGGTIANARPPFTDPDGATHCFIEVGKIAFSVDLTSLVEKGVWCVPPIYLSNYLMQDPLPDAASCQIVEAQNILAAKQKHKPSSS